MKSYNKPDAFQFEQAFTRGTVYFIFACIISIFIWLLFLISFGSPATSFFLWISICILMYIPHLLFVRGYFESGIEYDFINLRYRRYFSQGIFRWGKWKVFEEPELFLILKSTNQFFNWWRTQSGISRIRRFSFFYHEPYFYYQLFLITKIESDHLIFTSEGFDLNLLTAKHLSNHLKIPVYERTIKGDNLIYSPTQDQHNK